MGNNSRSSRTNLSIVQRNNPPPIVLEAEKLEVARTLPWKLSVPRSVASKSQFMSITRMPYLIDGMHPDFEKSDVEPPKFFEDDCALKSRLYLASPLRPTTNSVLSPQSILQNFLRHQKENQLNEKICVKVKFMIYICEH